MQLSKHFSLDEFTFSQTAVRFGIDNNPREEIVNNLKLLCENCLEPLRELLGKPIRITSGYRCPTLNGLIGGSKHSHHMVGMAADIKVKGMNTELLFQTIIESEIQYCQNINEFENWVHISFQKDFNKRENLRAILKNGKTVYLKEKF